MQNLDIAIPIYNLLEYSDKYSKTSGVVNNIVKVST